MIVALIWPLYLRNYTQSIAVLIYSTSESPAVLGLWVWLGGIRPTRSKFDLLGCSYRYMIVALTTAMNY